MRHHFSNDNLDLYTSAGVKLGPNHSATSAEKGVTLGVGTYYLTLAEMQIGAHDLVGVHMKWAAALAATITMEVCNFNEVSAFDATAGNWVTYNPTGAYVPTAGTGNSATNATVTAGGTNAGGCVYSLADVATKRVRFKIVTTVGGLFRAGVSAK